MLYRSTQILNVLWVSMTDMLSSWFGIAPKTTPLAIPEPTALQVQRCKQIEQLRTLNGFASIVELQRDVEYRVTVSEASGLFLYITLPTQFPQQRPQVRASVRVSHPWINEQLIVVGCPGINNFMVHSDLGRVIRELVEEFRRNPPVFVASSSSSFCGASGGAITSWATNQQPQTTASAWPQVAFPPSSFHNTQPYYPPTAGPQHAVVSSHATGRSSPFVELDKGSSDLGQISADLGKLSNSELEDLLTKEDRLSDMLSDLPEMLPLADDRLRILESLEQLANDNCARKLQLDERKRVVLEKYDHLNDLRGKFDDAARRQEELRSTYDLRLLQDRFKVAASEAEEEAETVAQNFLERKISLDEFDRAFLKIRTLGHVRRAKEDKLSQQLPNTFRTSNF